jgi:hypothetical protein
MTTYTWDATHPSTTDTYAGTGAGTVLGSVQQNTAAQARMFDPAMGDTLATFVDGMIRVNSANGRLEKYSVSGSAWNALPLAQALGFTAAPLNGPAFTGAPSAPTAAAGTNSTQLATTSFVATSFAPLASPVFTGTVAGAAYNFSGNGTVGGNLAVTGTTALTGNATAAGTLGVTGLVTGGRFQTASTGSAYGSGFQVYASGGGAFGLYDTTQGTDAKSYDIFCSGSSLFIRAVNDAASSATNALQFIRSGITITTAIFNATVMQTNGQVVASAPGSTIPFKAVTAAGSANPTMMYFQYQGTTSGFLQSSSTAAFNFLNAATTASVSIDQSANMVATGNISGYGSDERLKRNKTRITQPMKLIRELCGFEFDWDMEKCRALGFQPKQLHEHGFMAQTVQRVLPEAVTRMGGLAGEQDYLTVIYSKVVPHHNAALMELDDRVARLERLVEAV